MSGVMAVGELEVEDSGELKGAFLIRWSCMEPYPELELELDPALVTWLGVLLGKA